MMVVCPRDGASLVEVNKSGVQIDVCPECKGVWLDRGELEKIMQITRDLEREFADPPRVQTPHGSMVKVMFDPNTVILEAMILAGIAATTMMTMMITNATVTASANANRDCPNCSIFSTELNTTRVGTGSQTVPIFLLEMDRVNPKLLAREIWGFKRVAGEAQFNPSFILILRFP
jgi:Zn-finger nucleic acid-binding protein